MREAAIILLTLALAGCGMDKYDKRNAFRQCIQADGNRPPIECAEAVDRVYGPSTEGEWVRSRSIFQSGE